MYLERWYVCEIATPDQAARRNCVIRSVPFWVCGVGYNAPIAGRWGYEDFCFIIYAVGEEDWNYWCGYIMRLLRGAGA